VGNEKVKKVFRSRISVLFIVIILAISLPITIQMIIHPILPVVLFVGGLYLFYTVISGGVRYIISEDTLYVKKWKISCGTVKIPDIISIERSYEPYQTHATSLKRLRIRYRKNARFTCKLISPVREQEFIEELKAVNPDIFVRIPVKNGIWRVQDWDI
jgi:hypothetical protein